MYKFQNLDRNIDRDYLKNINPSDKIERNKALSKNIKEIRQLNKSGTCYYCGKPVTSYCKSHSIPRFCLENIEEKGMVTGINSIMGLPDMGVSIGKHTIGIGEAGTFSIICRECDQMLFREYENPANYLDEAIPTQKMMAQIAMKNYIKFIHKKEIEISMLERLMTQGSDFEISNLSDLYEVITKLQVYKTDLIAYQDSFEQAKRVLNTGKKGYYLFYYKLLEYVVPIAFQAPIALSIDLGDGVINDVFNKDLNYKITDIHICVFPLLSKTAVMLFVEEGDKRYRKFRKQFKKLDEEAKLGVINYIVFLYGEDYYMAKNVRDMIDTKELRDVVNTIPILWNDSPSIETGILTEKYSLGKWNSIPNLLSEQYKLR